jgi:hypothetical protein
MKTQNSLISPVKFRALKGFITSLGLILGTSALAVGATSKVSVYLTNGEFSNGQEIHRDSGANRILTAHQYTYKISGKLKSQAGTGLDKLLKNNGDSFESFLDSLSPGSSELLHGSFDDVAGTFPVTLINKTISGTKTFTGFGKVKISLNITARIDEAGKCYVDVTNVKFRSTPKLTPLQLKALGTLKFTSGTRMELFASPSVFFSKGVNPIEENAGSVAVAVRRGPSLNGVVTVAYITEDITADSLNSLNYTSKSGTITFAEGVALANIVIDITDNANNDSNRTFKIKLIDPLSGATFGTIKETTVNIVDDE